MHVVGVEVLGIDLKLGRAGLGGQGWLTYSVSPRTRFQFGYRHQEVSKDFIGGGRSVDYTLSAETMMGHRVGLSSWVQGEEWYFPMLSALRQSNITASVQVTFYPGLHLKK